MRVSDWYEYVNKEMRLDFAELTVRRFKDRGFNIHGIPSIADQQSFVVAEVAEVEEAAPSGVGSVHEKTGEIIKPDIIVEDDDENLDLESIMTAEEVKTSGLRGIMRALEGKCRSIRVEVSVHMMAVVAQAEKSMDSERAYAGCGGK